MINIMDIPEAYRWYYAQALSYLYKDYPNVEFEHVVIVARPASAGMAEKGALFSHLYFLFLCSDFEVINLQYESGFAGKGLYQVEAYNSYSQGNVTCPTCNGRRGSVYNSETEAWETCPECGGSGTVVGQVILLNWSGYSGGIHTKYYPNDRFHDACPIHGPLNSDIIYCNTVLDFEGVVLYPLEMSPDGAGAPTYSYVSDEETLTLYTTEIDGNSYD